MLKKLNIPKGWEKGTVGDLARGIRGVTFSSEDILSSDEPTAVVLLRSNNIKDSRINFDKVYLLPSAEVSEDQIARAGDVAVCMSNGSKRLVGKAARLTAVELRRKVSVGAFCALFRPTSGADNNFVPYLFDTESYRRELDITLAGSAINNLKNSDIEGIKIPLPPIAEQRKIAEILRTWDEAIETAEAELKAKQERKRGLMQKLMSPGGQIEAKKTNSFRDSVKRFALPGDWRWMFIHDVAKVSFSSVDKKSVEGEKAVRLCNYMDVFYNRRIREGMAFMDSTASDSDIKKFTLNKGDVVLTKDSETPEEIAFAAVIDEQIDNLVCGYHLAVLRPDRAKVTGEYLMSAINFQPNHHQFIRLANGATRFGLGIDSLSNAIIPVPPMDVQRNIAEILKSADAEVELINKRIDFLRTQKRGLMQKLLTGEVRVKV